MDSDCWLLLWQVSRVWRVLAEDAVLWFRICTREGFHVEAGVSDSPCWKSTLRDCRKAARTVCSNWKVCVSGVNEGLPGSTRGHSKVIISAF